ncbi:MAG: hypothetical protein PHR43_00700 [Dehalococcoidales bacterium]|nr:hypothetical protein [Dehalococcoidales bacterium]
MNKPNADFCLEINYEKNTSNPERVFKAMTELIETFQSVDKALTKSIDNNIETILILQDIETGSIKTWLSNALNAVDDSALHHLDWKPQVGKYLVKAKYYIIDYLNGKTTITNITELQPLREKLLNEAKNSNSRWLPIYNPIDLTQLLDSIQKISSGVSYLRPQDKVSYITPQERASFNLTFNLTPEKLQELLTANTIKSQRGMIIKVKKPDLLGESMWEFRFGDKNIMAKMADKSWLLKFQAREFNIQPQDALRVTMDIEEKYDGDGNLTDTDYTVTSVHEVIPFHPSEQLPLSGESA